MRRASLTAGTYLGLRAVPLSRVTLSQNVRDVELMVRKAGTPVAVQVSSKGLTASATLTRERPPPVVISIDLPLIVGSDTDEALLAVFTQSLDPAVQPPECIFHLFQMKSAQEAEAVDMYIANLRHAFDTALQHGINPHLHFEQDMEPMPPPSLAPAAVGTDYCAPGIPPSEVEYKDVLGSPPSQQPLYLTSEQLAHRVSSSVPTPVPAPQPKSRPPVPVAPAPQPPKEVARSRPLPPTGPAPLPPSPRRQHSPPRARHSAPLIEVGPGFKTMAPELARQRSLSPTVGWRASSQSLATSADRPGPQKPQGHMSASNEELAEWSPLRWESAAPSSPLVPGKHDVVGGSKPRRGSQDSALPSPPRRTSDESTGPHSPTGGGAKSRLGAFFGRALSGSRLSHSGSPVPAASEAAMAAVAAVAPAAALRHGLQSGSPATRRSLTPASPRPEMVLDSANMLYDTPQSHLWSTHNLSSNNDHAQHIFCLDELLSSHATVSEGAAAATLATLATDHSVSPAPAVHHRAAAETPAPRPAAVVAVAAVAARSPDSPKFRRLAGRLGGLSPVTLADDPAASLPPPPSLGMIRATSTTRLGSNLSLHQLSVLPAPDYDHDELDFHEQVRPTPDYGNGGGNFVTSPWAASPPSARRPDDVNASVSGFLAAMASTSPPPGAFGVAQFYQHQAVHHRAALARQSSGHSDAAQW